jgi:hypothetical protein
MTLELKLINILSITTLIVNAEYNIFSARYAKCRYVECCKADQKVHKVVISPH